LGHVHIATLNGLPEFTYAAARHRGFLRAYEARGLKPDPALQFEVSMTEEAGYAVAAGLLDASSPPTAFLCGSLFLARGVYRALEEKGLRPGREISVIAHDDQLRSIRAGSFAPQLTATEVPIRHSGERLSEILIDQVLNSSGPRVALQEIAPVELVVRESIAPAMHSR
jgi:LacI family transcriptional regulator